MESKRIVTITVDTSRVGAYVLDAPKLEVFYGTGDVAVEDIRNWVPASLVEFKDPFYISASNPTETLKAALSGNGKIRLLVPNQTVPEGEIEWIKISVDCEMCKFLGAPDFYIDFDGNYANTYVDNMEG